MERPRILIIGAGMVGSSSAAAVAARNLGEIFLYDSERDLAPGRAMDINHSLPSMASDSRVNGINSLDEAAGSDIVVITAGLARKAGMTRLDLLRHNASVVSALAPRLAGLCPNARVLLVTNPVDVLTWHLTQLCPGMRVFGLGCALDTVRMRHFIASEARVSVKGIAAMVMGTHDDSMIPLVARASICGIPAATLLGKDAMDRIVASTKTAGSAIVNLMKTHSGHYAAGEVIADIAESMALDQGMVFPVSVCPRGEFGYSGTCLALPCIIDKHGVRQIVEMELDSDEKAMLAVCARNMGEQIGLLKGLS